jgi:hypothetical protein
MAMMAKLKSERVVSQSDTLEDGIGVYSIATHDESGAGVMVWNYQHIQQQSYDVTVDTGELPANLRGVRLCQRIYRIDDRVSNYWGNPETANLQQVAASIIRPTQRHRVAAHLTPNALQLITLEPATDGGCRVG